MYAYLAILLAVAAVLWLDPIITALVGPPAAPVLPKTARPPINESLLALEDGGYQAGHAPWCPPDAYSVQVFSKAPLVLYIENFLSEAEMKHLVEISGPLYEVATITHDGGSSAQRDTTVRDSQVAVVPRDRVVRCIEARARRLQGWRDELWIERLRVQRYTAPAGHYGYHFDWSRTGAATGGWGRVSSLMVFVDDGRLDRKAGGKSDGKNLVGGGTAFPRLPRRSADSRWCRFIACTNGGTVLTDPNYTDGSATNTTGAIFKPVVGNAVYWENFRPDGTGRAFDETWHAGMRVEQGVKIGLNIWSWGRVD